MSGWLDDFIDGEDFRHFLKAVESFCETLERVESLPKAVFLRNLDSQLPQVYSAASVLPEYPWDEDEDDSAIDRSLAGALTMELSMAERIRAKLGHLDRYTFVFDPVDRDDEQAIPGSLAEDLASVYADLKQPLESYRGGTVPEIKKALWDWAFGRKIHWGRHGVHAMGVVYSLVHQHYDEDDKVFDVKADAVTTDN